RTPPHPRSTLFPYTTLFRSLIDTFRVASAEAINIDVGDTLELATTARAHGYRGFTRRVPVGPCSFIAPFNFPLNLAAHKIAPAIDQKSTRLNSSHVSISYAV